MEFHLPPSFFDEKCSTPVKNDPGYFQRCYHAPDAYCRTENWYSDVKDYSFPTTFIPLTEPQALAILRYREETKLRAALFDQEQREAEEAKMEVKPEPGMGFFKDSTKTPTNEDPQFLDDMFTFLWKDWQIDKETIEWQQSLETLCSQLEQAISSSGNNGAFVKLSNRSPKDAALNTSRTYEHIRTLMARDPSLSDVELINFACTESLRCTSGLQALRLLLESDRVYTDISTYRLYMEPKEPFSLQLAVREWCPLVDPGWEFRLFIRDSHTTGLTIYNDFYHSTFMNMHKDDILEMILNCWSKVNSRIHLHCVNYCIDFAITPDLAKIFIIEVNPFVPPIAGSGLFNYHNPRDRALLESGPFEFRLRDGPNIAGSTVVDYKNDAGEDGQYVRSLSPPLLRFIQSHRESPPNLRSSNEAAPQWCAIL